MQSRVDVHLVVVVEIRLFGHRLVGGSQVVRLLQRLVHVVRVLGHRQLHRQVGVVALGVDVVATTSGGCGVEQLEAFLQRLGLVEAVILIGHLVASIQLMDRGWSVQGVHDHIGGR